MDCTNPSLFTPERLLAFAHGEPDEALEPHLRVCPPCANSMAAYGIVDRALGARLYRVECPPTQELGELALDLLTPEAALLARTHLAGCPHCQAEFSTLRAGLAGNPLLDLARRPSPFRRLVAHLLPPPGEVMAYAMVRGEASDTVRSYEAEGITVSLTLEPSGSGVRRWNLLGLVLPDGDAVEPPTGITRLSLQERLVGEAPLDDLGNLVFSDVAAGLYDLEITLPDSVVVLEGVRIGPREDEASA
ncbi:MAG TPA: hypothetical protein VNL35_06740 [Chloroflexota bacterium]|nr:hypothetical protein [Chloroflexota bacterium]